MDRRDTDKRADLVRQIAAAIVQNPHAVVTRESLQTTFGVSSRVAGRILKQLVSSGLIHEVKRGVWARSI